MTSEDRLVDIHNYLQYLDGIKRGVLDQCPEAEITLLGFSQGAATVSRWVMHGEANWQRLILWGGLWPPDLPFALGREKLTGKEIHFVYGKKDPFFKPGHLETLVELSSKLNVRPFIRPFDGEHEIDLDVLSEIMAIKP
jgi:predicted esterase